MHEKNEKKTDKVFIWIGYFSANPVPKGPTNIFYKYQSNYKIFENAYLYVCLFARGCLP